MKLLEPNISIGERASSNVAAAATALTFGTTTAWVQTLKWSQTGITFQISPGTFVAFILGTIAGLMFWRVFASSRVAARFATYGLLVFVAAMLFFPFRHIPKEHLAEISVGFSLAIIVVGGGVGFIWKMLRALEAETEKADAENSRVLIPPIATR